MTKLLARLSLRRRLFIGILLCIAVALGIHTAVAYRQLVHVLHEVGVYHDLSLRIARHVLLHSLLPTLLASLGIAALAAILQIYPVINLLHRLTTAAHAIASGQFHHRVRLSRWAPYDFHLLAESFNLMAAQLADLSARQKRQQEELRSHNELLARLAVTDALTQVGNHRAFQEHLHVQISLAARKGLPLCLMLIDVDYFKQYNDTHGHLQGDTVLREVARLLTENIRTYDFVARYGGEEFAVILPDTDIETAYVVAERVRQIIEHHPFPNRQMTISVGLASWRAGVDPGKLIQEADEALYEAKRSGRNRVCLAKLDRRAA
ncbi:MAG: GGDEF domain-containing protein [Armatimonadota bacterium]|nr:GGDEF domain-containing protein [bacterium]MDW8321478.1 GGDEF domain-containing protein [Armatimonadota bacterium]